MNQWNILSGKRWDGVPIFLLALSCGISSGGLMAMAFLLHVVLCRKQGIPVFTPFWRQSLFRKTMKAVMFMVFCAVVTFPFNDSQPRIFLRYFERMAPFFLLLLMMRPQLENGKLIWLGITASLAGQIISVFLHPVWQGGRLLGNYGSPNGLAAILLILIPVVFFGVLYYRRTYVRLSLLAGGISFVAVVLMICTGSRNACLSFAVVLLLLAYFLYRGRDRTILKGMGLLLLLLCIGVAFWKPEVISSRLDRNIQQDGRVYLLQSSVQLVREHPFIGIGLGNWGKVYKERFEAQNPLHEKGIQSPHNIYLQVWNEVGGIGLVGFLAIIFFQIKTMVASLRVFYRSGSGGMPWIAGFSLPMAAIFLFGMFDYDFFSRHTMQLYWFYWGAYLCAVQFLPKEMDEQ